MMDLAIDKNNTVWFTEEYGRVLGDVARSKVSCQVVREMPRGEKQPLQRCSDCFFCFAATKER